MNVTAFECSFKPAEDPFIKTLEILMPTNVTNVLSKTITCCISLNHDTELMLNQWNISRCKPIFEAFPTRKLSPCLELIHATTVQVKFIIYFVRTWTVFPVMQQATYNHNHICWVTTAQSTDYVHFVGQICESWLTKETARFRNAPSLRWKISVWCWSSVMILFF